MWLLNISNDSLEERVINSRTAKKYSATPLSISFLFSLMSITCPAYNAKDKAGITSLKPINPMAKGSCVSSNTHQPTSVPSILKAIMKENLPKRKFLNSGNCVAAKALCLFIQ